MKVRECSLPVLRGLFFFAICLSTMFSPVGVRAGGSAPERYSVAMRNFGVWEPDAGGRLDFSVWYPSSGAPSEFVREGWIVKACKGGHVLPGFYPVVLVSHDTVSSRFANNDLAGALASGGMIVIVPAHTDDNQNSSEGIYTARLLRERPRHLLLALETVLGAPDFAPHADESRIGLLGIGFGAISVMQLAGAIPDFKRLEGYCGAASGQDAFCSPWVSERLASIPETLFMFRQEGAGALSPPLDLFAPPLVAVAVSSAEEQSAEGEKTHQPAGIQKSSFWQRIFSGSEEERPEGAFQSNSTGRAAADASPPALQNAALALDFQGDPLFGGTDSGAPFMHIALSDSPQFRFSPSDDPAAVLKLDPSPAVADPSAGVYRRLPECRRIRGMALLAPAGGMLFSRAALADIHIPTAVLEAGQDGLYPPSQHAHPYFANLPVQPMLLQLPEADHFSLFALCARETMINLGEVCGRMVGDDRRELAGQRDTFLVSFFQAALGGPLPSAPPSGYVAGEQGEEQP